jgi:hypothetical protein
VLGRGSPHRTGRRLRRRRAAVAMPGSWLLQRTGRPPLTVVIAPCAQAMRPTAALPIGPGQRTSACRGRARKRILAPVRALRLSLPRVFASVSEVEPRVTAWGDLRERRSIPPRCLLRPCGAGVRPGRSGAPGVRPKRARVNAASRRSLLYSCRSRQRVAGLIEQAASGVISATR